MSETLYSEKRRGMKPEVQSMGGGSVAVNWSPTESQSGFGRMVQTLSVMLESQRKAEEQRQEKMKKQADMYKTLRESGYDPKSAYDAVQKNQLPGPGSEMLKEEKAKSEIAKTQADTEKSKAETLKAQADASRGGKTPLTEQQMLTNKSKKQLAIQAIRTGKAFDPRTGADAFVDFTNKDDVLAYIATLGVDLEDEQIQSELNNKFTTSPEKATEKGTAEEKVLMKRPDGATVRIKASDVQAAIGTGYKRIEDA